MRRLWGLLVIMWVAAAEARYYHMAYAGYRKDDPTTEAMVPESDYADGKDRMGVLYRSPSIYQPSYYHQSEVKPIEESVEVETYPLAPYEHLEEPAPAPPPPTAAPAAPSEKRQQPYSYYYIGRKLWYIPLYFSLYFVIYVAALIIRAITRHKITFPDRLPQQARALLSSFGANSTSNGEEEGLNQNAADVNKILDDLFVKYS